MPPKVTHVVISSPTVSQVLYDQMIGRGLRGPKFGGLTIQWLQESGTGQPASRGQVTWLPARSKGLVFAVTLWRDATPTFH